MPSSEHWDLEKVAHFLAVCSARWGEFKPSETCCEACNNVGGQIKTVRKMEARCDARSYNGTYFLPAKGMACDLSKEIGNAMGKPKTETGEDQCEKFCSGPSKCGAGKLNVPTDSSPRQNKKNRSPMGTCVYYC